MHVNTCATHAQRVHLSCTALPPGPLTTDPPARLPARQDYPEFRQADSLKAAVDERVVKDGLLGLGVAGAVAAVAVGVLLGAGRRK